MALSCFELVGFPSVLIALSLSLAWASTPTQVARWLKSARLLGVHSLTIDHPLSDG